MDPKLTFYPVGNGNSSLIDLPDDRQLLFDYCDLRDPLDPSDKRIDLPAAIRSAVRAKGRDYLDVVLFTHADRDHLGRADEFFWFDHATKYQGPDRIKMKELWIPAALMLEEGLIESARVVRQEARHRLRLGRGIRIFSAPGAMDDWFRSEGIDADSRRHLFTHAGELVPGFSVGNGDLEIFVHSPYSFRFDDDPEDRNNGCVVLHLTFSRGSSTSRVFYGADAEYQAWNDIVLKTEQRGRTERLKWDLFEVSHHCSSTALGPDPGETRTQPIPEVERLFGYRDGTPLIVASCKPIDSTPQPPPHFQAAAYYRTVVDSQRDFIVTMEHPSESRPAPFVVEVTPWGLRPIRSVPSGVSVVTSTPSPRFGR